MDNRLIAVPPLPRHELRKDDLEWFVADENEGYIADDFIRVSRSELDSFRTVSTDLFHLLLEAANRVAERKAWRDVGIPSNAIPLLTYSLQHELDNYLVGRFDFAGGIEGLPIKLLEINADTCSLMTETAFIQEHYWELEQNQLSGRPFNLLLHGLKLRFQDLLRRNPNKAANLLISTFGYEEDVLNMRVIERAAKMAGFTDVKITTLEEVIFSEEEGIFLPSKTGEYVRYDFWYKFTPWDILANDEPELFDILEQIVRKRLCVILNPAFSMLLQSKALLKFAHDLSPRHAHLLKTSFQSYAFFDNRFVRKPLFGRMGENIAFFDGKKRPVYETEGDYGDQSSVYQELAEFNEDAEEYRYQPSIYWTGEASALCFRKQDDLILDDDADFVCHIIEAGERVSG